MRQALDLNLIMVKVSSVAEYFIEWYKKCSAKEINAVVI